ncbi:MAG: hypothetical protein CAPSK01_003885 [Candidatus Accumulibacter vicinus]|uniref:Heme utilization protein n=1 Tax=Candidatus Accumulibacter vicinus TaxID=2954382 RepID=A0A084XWV2_9PROT|nr:MAG: hypothetical protein CAPSK01_003885 [Candidatus Accumulibacter vicinus]
MDATDVSAFKTSQVAALTTSQIAIVLGSSQIAGIGTTQVAALTTSQVASLGTSQVVALTTAQVRALTTNQLVNGLTTTQLQAIEATDVAALKTSQIAALANSQIANLGTAQVVALTTTQVGALTATQIASGLTTAQVSAMEAADIAALRTSQIVALTTAQAAALTVTQIASGLTTAQVKAMEAADVAALGTTQLAALTAAQVPVLTLSQLAAMSTAQTYALKGMFLTTTQLAALTTAQVNSASTPLILDLNEDGKLSQSISSGVQFDLLATGTKVHTGWVASGDGLLAMDRNGDGTINDGGELFGSSVTLANGEKAADGYVALSEMDSNADGIISSADDHWSELAVWVDGNSDGISQSEELRSLESLEIVRLDLNATRTAVMDAGNLVGLISSYQTADGTDHEMADVWFATDRNAASQAAPPTTAAAAVDLRANVGNLLQAISSFNMGQAAPDPNAPGTSLLPQLAPQASIAALLQQYDPNGNPFGAFQASQTVATNSLTNPPSLDAITKGMLATGN